MAFTEKDLEAQISLFEELKEEFSRLEAKEKAFMKEQNISLTDLKIDLNNLTPEEKRLVAHAQNEAKKAGANRMAQTQIQNTTVSTAGAGRKGVIRL